MQTVVCELWRLRSPSPSSHPSFPPHCSFLLFPSDWHLSVLLSLRRNKKRILPPKIATVKENKPSSIDTLSTSIFVCYTYGTLSHFCLAKDRNDNMNMSNFTSNYAFHNFLNILGFFIDLLNKIFLPYLLSQKKQKKQSHLRNI